MGKTGTVEVTISVADKDEYAPRFLNQTGYAFVIPGSAKKGAYIGTVAAKDEDKGMAGRLVYAFVQPSPYFYLDPFTGNITVAVTLHEEIDDDNNQQRKKRWAFAEK